MDERKNSSFNGANIANDAKVGVDEVRQLFRAHSCAPTPNITYNFLATQILITKGQVTKDGESQSR